MVSSRHAHGESQRLVSEWDQEQRAARCTDSSCVSVLAEPAFPATLAFDAAWRIEFSERC